MGRHLGQWLRAAGPEEIDMEAHVRLANPGHYYRFHLLNLIATVRDAIIGQALLTCDELDELVAETRRHLERPETIVLRLMLFQAWGQKPVA